MLEDRTMSACANRHLKSLGRLWEEPRADRPLPSRAELDVSVLRPWLGSLALFEFQSERGPVFRLCGTSLHQRFGGEFTGQPVSALEPDMAGHLERYFTATLISQKPQWATHIARNMAR